ncbi:MAG: DUF6056 family protein [Kofleriaceae bacterium]
MRFWAVIAATFVVLAVICGLEPPLGDGWGHFSGSRVPWSWDGFVEAMKMGYEHGNPRWGQIPLSLSFRAWWITALISPLMIVGGLVVMMALLRARWPDPRDPKDTWLFVRVLAVALVITPQVGGIWFYRPICTNYMYPLALQLLWIVPYRFLAARAPRSRIGSLVLAIAIVPVGVLAGAGNEHTGLGLAVAALVCVVVAAKRDRMIPLWSLTGLAALIAGYIFLLTAPGQQMRYGGLAAQQSSVFEPVFDRGFVGNLGVLGLLVAWASPMLLLVGISARVARWKPSPAVRRQLLVYFGLAAILFGTALLSPRLTARLLVATSTVVALALGTIMIELEDHERVSRWMRRACATIAIGFLSIALAINVTTGVQGRDRMALITGAPEGAVVHIPAYTFSMATPFSWGDDMRNDSLRERTAKRYALEQIVYDD